jgi:predicted RNA-binding Zn-ribbon protein involved in translation (DUF1610 family)
MTSELHIIPLKCPSCAAKLDIASDMEQFACGFCGTTLMVRRAGGTISLRTVTDAISKVQAGTDKTASELAIQRLDTERIGLAARRAEIERTGQAGINGIKSMLAGAVIAIFAIVFMLGLIVIKDTTVGIIASLGFSLILLAPVVYIQQKRKRSVRGEMEASFRQLDARVQVVNRELQHHRRTVRVHQ